MQRTHILPLLLSWCLASAASAQSELYRFDGDAANDQLGGSNTSTWDPQPLSDAGDVDADGVEDWIVGARHANYARVYAGADGSVLHTLHAPAGGDFGVAVSGAGDVDGDGHDDLIVGAHLADSAYLFSGADGALIRTLTGSLNFGVSVDGLGDVDGDGLSEVVVGAPESPGRGQAHVFSGADGSELFSEAGTFSNAQFGWCVSLAGDVNADGIPDVVIAANGSNSSTISYAQVYAGGSWQLLHHVEGDKPFASFVVGPGDVNADGYDDFWTNNRAWSGADGTILHDLSASYGTVSCAADLGDFDGDGADDFCFATNADELFLLSGTTGEVLLDFPIAPGENYGAMARGGRDPDTDRERVIVAAPNADYAAENAGALYAYSIDLDEAPTYTTTGLVAGSNATLQISGAAPDSVVLFAYSLTGPGPTSTAVGDVDMSPPILNLPRVHADSDGCASHDLPIPASSQGRTVYTQAVILDSGIATLSNSLQEVIQ